MSSHAKVFRARAKALIKQAETTYFARAIHNSSRHPIPYSSQKHRNTTTKTTVYSPVGNRWISAVQVQHGHERISENE